MVENQRRIIFGIIAGAMLPMVGTFAGAPKSALPTIKQVKADMKRVADWQIVHLEDGYGRSDNPRASDLDAWTYGALYVGMEKWAEVAGDEKYYTWLKGIADGLEWDLRAERFYHADDHAIGQLYLSLYEKYKDPKMIEATRKQFDEIMQNTPTGTLDHTKKGHSQRWSWCDALFMAPPVWAQLSAATGDPKYRDWMFGEYKATTEYLFDKDEKLYYRDSRFFDQRHNGSKIFWSRGNGWVFGGLALLIPEIPKPSEQYDYFVGIYKKMAEKLVSIQTPQGYWAMSLLEADAYPTPEASGTGFYCFGLAWGINNGLLDRATYEPAVLKAWAALTRCITEDGMLGYVQPIGAEPGQAWPDRTEVYGSGAFLAAGAEVVRMLEK